MAKIISITLNTAIDNLIEIDTFKQGSVIRAKHAAFYASGKAINSTRTISCLGKDVTALCFVGKNEAHFYNQLESKHITLKLHIVEGTTRSNITIVNANNDLIMHLQTHGYKLSKKLLQLFTNQLKTLISAGDIIIISGSLPDGLPHNYYKTLIEMCHKKGGKVIFDSSGVALFNGLEGIPYAVKPNLEELKDLSDKSLLNKSDIVKEAKNLNNKGIEYVFVSMEKKGVLLTKRGEAGYWEANVKLPASEHKGDEIGCGDAMIGGIAVSLSENSKTEDVLILATACGAANILSKGPGICDLRNVALLSKQVTIKFFK